jgi:hypothetical protein
METATISLKRLKELERLEEAVHKGEHIYKRFHLHDDNSVLYTTEEMRDMFMSKLEKEHQYHVKETKRRIDLEYEIRKIYKTLFGKPYLNPSVTKDIIKKINIINHCFAASILFNLILLLWIILN